MVVTCVCNCFIVLCHRVCSTEDDIAFVNTHDLYNDKKTEVLIKSRK